MATTKRIKSSLQSKHMGMGLATIILALILSVSFLVLILARPKVEVSHGMTLYLDGIIASAIILGAMLWAVIEALTPPGNTIALLWRAGAGLLIGGAAGAYIGYSFSFAQYVIIPFYHGNSYAIFYVLAIVIFGLVAIWDAAWSHRHGYMGQGGKSARKLGFKESGRAKGYRKMAGLIIGLIFVFLMVPASAYTGTAIASLNDHDGLPLEITGVSGFSPSHNLSQSAISISSTGYYGISNTSLSTSQATSDNRFINTISGYLPSYITQNSTGANITNYIQSVYLTTNTTMSYLSSYLVQDLYLILPNPGIYNITMGTGNATDFSPLIYLDNNQTMNISLNSGSSGRLLFQQATATPFVVSTTTYRAFDFHISPALLTGNLSQSVSFKLTTQNQTQLSILSFAVGSTSTTLIGPLQLEDAGYVIGTFMTLIAAILVAPWYDLKPLPGVKSKRGGR